MSQCSRVTSIPNAAIAAAPIDPMICSDRAAIASNARPRRSSSSTSAGTPKTSCTAHNRAQSATRTIAAGCVNRFAINTSIT